MRSFGDDRPRGRLFRSAAVKFAGIVALRRRLCNVLAKINILQSKRAEPTRRAVSVGAGRALTSAETSPYRASTYRARLAADRDRRRIASASQATRRRTRRPW